jgi:LppP/LprE lipoprotein
MRRSRSLAALMGGALFLGAAGCGSTGSAAAPTSTVAPTATPAVVTATPIVITATAVPPAPTGTSGPASIPTAPVDPVVHDPTVVRAKGYDPSQRFVQTSDSSGQNLYAWHGVCHGSADGYCQKMFFFIGSTYLGTDTGAASIDIMDFQPAGPGSIAVTYANYKSNDPFCCPTGRPATITYHWNGTRLVASGIPPGH